MKWKEIRVPALETTLSTGRYQPLAREDWQEWAQKKADYSGAWLSYVGGPLAMSTGTLSTGNVQAYIDMERRDRRPPSLRYYRYPCAKTIDGRVFQYGPIKDLEYKRHREQRPPCLASYITTSTSTG